MKKLILKALLLSLSVASGAMVGGAEPVVKVVPLPVPGIPRSENSRPTEHFAPSSVQTQLKVDLGAETREVRFVRDNSDPYVITRAYRIEHADPYAMRGYLLSAISAKQIDASPAQVEALKFTDGGGLLLVSAEDYRFHDSEAGEGIDSIIARLDREGLGFRHNSPTFIYFPKYNTAANLSDMLKRVGANIVSGEFAAPPEELLVDGGLNAVLVSGPEWSWNNMKTMLESYDRPIPEVSVSYRVIEIYAENDDKIGVDFQSWKNNDGVDIFSAGMRYRRNWSNFFTGGVDNNGTNKVTFWNFNPKWNTRYLDFLTSIGKAKILASGVLTARNRETSDVQVDSGFFYDRTDASYTESDAEFYYTSPNPDIIPRQGLDKILPETELLEILPNAVRGDYNWRMLGNLAGSTQYGTVVGEKITEQMAIISSETATQEQKLQAYQQLQTLLQEEGLGELLNYSYYTSNPLTGEKLDSSLSNAMPGVIHGKMQLPMPQEGFTFRLSVTPVVTSRSATLDIEMSSISLIGWNSDGSPRSSSSEVATTVQVGYEAEEFVIGGLRKSEAVRGVAGLPFFKDIPILGLLFADETESLKQSQLVLIATVKYSPPNETVPARIDENIGKIIDDVNKGMRSPVGNMFFQQYLIDTDKIE